MVLTRKANGNEAERSVLEDMLITHSLPLGNGTSFSALQILDNRLSKWPWSEPFPQLQFLSSNLMLSDQIQM